MCTDSEGQCAHTCPWGGAAAGRAGLGMRMGRVSSPCLAVQVGVLAGGAQLPSSPGPRGAGSVEIPKEIKWVHLIPNVNLSRRLISWR